MVGDEHEDRVPPRERAVGLAVAAVIEDVGGGSGGAVVVGDEDAGGLAREGSVVERGGVLFVGDRGAAVLRESCLVLFEQHGEGGVSLSREESEPLRFTMDGCLALALRCPFRQRNDHSPRGIGCCTKENTGTVR